MSSKTVLIVGHGVSLHSVILAQLSDLTEKVILIDLEKAEDIRAEIAMSVPPSFSLAEMEYESISIDKPRVSSKSKRSILSKTYTPKPKHNMRKQMCNRRKH